MQVRWACVGVVPIITSAVLSATLTVDDDGADFPAADFSDIQSAVDAAIPGDEVIVYPGTYTGTGDQVVDMLGKSITLRASGTAVETIIDGEEQRRGITCDSSESATTIIDGLTITNGYGSEGPGGAGILCYNNSSPTIQDCIISANSLGSSRDGGGILCRNGSDPLIDRCIISFNAGGDGCLGAGIGCTNGSSPHIRDCTITDNAAGESVDHWNPGRGGGIGCGSGSTWSGEDTCSPTIENCVISGNYASTTGGGIYFGDANNTNPATPPLVIDCTITNNSSMGDGGGIGCETTDPETGDPHSPIIERCTITFNTAATDGGGISGRSMFGEENGVYLNTPVIIIRDDCTISDNVASSMGGGISMHSSRPIIDDCKIERNRASSSPVDSQTAGGGILLGESCSATITGCIVRDNAAAGGGGGIGFYANTATLSNCTIDGNVALGGGGLGGAESTVSVSNCTISGNLATAGSGIGLYGCVGTVTDCLIRDNNGDYGGGIAVYEGSPTFLGCTITGNTADLGGGVYASWCQTELTGCYIVANSASLDGGGIMCDLAAVAILASTTVCGNDTAQGDATVQISGAWTDLTDNTISETCSATCQGDLNFDNAVTSSDLQLLIAAWGSDNPDIDFDGDGVVDIHDLLTLLESWGGCP